MSTLHIQQLREQERQALAMSVQSLYHLVHVRGLQVVAEQAYADEMRKDAVANDQHFEDLCNEINKLAEAHGIDAMDSTTAQLAQINDELLDRARELAQLRRYHKLVQLCMNGACSGMAEKAIVAEVERLKAEELPF